MRRPIVIAFALLSCVGCRRLLSSAIGADDADAATPSSSAVTVASAAAPSPPSAPVASASAAPSAAHAPSVVASAKPPPPKKGLPKCAAGQGLFSTGEGDTPFCAKSCGGDADCKPAKCDGPPGFSVNEKTGEVFVGVGKSVPLCGTAAASASPPVGGVLAVPAGGPGVIPNPKNLDCPDGYSNIGGSLKTCNKSCLKDGKCPKGSSCNGSTAVCF